MSALAELLRNDVLVNCVIAFALVECFVLLAYRFVTGKGIAATALVPNLAAGLFLLMALRCALSNASWQWIALALMAAGLAHALDLRMRWQSRVSAR